MPGLFWDPSEGWLAYALEYVLTLLGIVPYFSLAMRQRDGQSFIDAIYVVHLDAVELLGRQVLLDVLTVLGRQNHMAHTRSFGSKEFFLDSAHRQDIPAQRDLTSHGRQWTHLIAG